MHTLSALGVFPLHDVTHNVLTLLTLAKYSRKCHAVCSAGPILKWYRGHVGQMKDNVASKKFTLFHLDCTCPARKCNNVKMIILF